MVLARNTLLVLLALALSVTAPLVAAQGDPPVETLDRVALTIQGVPYTQSDIIHEYRLETFLASGKVADRMPSAADLASTLPRFIDQKMLESELGGRHFNAATINEDARRQTVAMRKQFRSQQDFEEALKSLGMNPAMLTERFAEQQKVLEMINDRLRPDASVSREQITEYYQRTLLPGIAREGGRAPSLHQAEGKIREILTQKTINQLLDDWLTELRKQHHVEIIARD